MLSCLLVEIRLNIMTLISLFRTRIYLITRFREKKLKLRVRINCVADVGGIQGMYFHGKLNQM